MRNFSATAFGESRHLAEITPFILTYNEAPNIGRCLDALDWASQILIVDSGSTDGTLELIARHRQARVVYRRFDSHSHQANFALSQIDSRWVLSLDADYILTPQFVQALRAGELMDDCAYFAPFRLCLNGRPLRRSLYPPRAVLFPRADAFYEQDGHTQRLAPAGRKPVQVPGFIFHDDRKSRERWMQDQWKYAELEAEKLCTTRRENLDKADLIRWVGCCAPLIIAPYVLFICGSILDGRLGIYYAFQRTYFEALLSLSLMKRRLRISRHHASARQPAAIP